jgi:hypothetical protein
MKPKIKQLKEQAYRIANVKSTNSLKRVHKAIAKLDLRLITSWIRTIEILRNLSDSIPIWDGSTETLDGAFDDLLKHQSKLVDDMNEIALNQISFSEEFAL